MPSPNVVEPSSAPPSVDQLLEWLQASVEARNVESTEACIAELFRDNPNRLLGATEAERARARSVHEAIDDGLRRVLFAGDVPGSAWERVLLPSDDHAFERPLWTANAMWLRLSGSERVARREESVDPGRYTGRPLADQARALGRMCVTTDAEREVDYAGLMEVLEPRLWPQLTSWLLSVYLQSPGGAVPERARRNQRRAVEALVAFWKGREGAIPIAPRAFGACYRDAYAGDQSPRPLAELVQGRFLRELFERERERAPAGGAETLAGLPSGGVAVVSSLWREEHVVHRCMGPLLEPLRRAGASAIVFEDRAGGERRPLPVRWRERCLSPTFEPGRPPLAQLAEVADRIERARLELLVYPEVGLTNDSLWLATQRLARVQLSGYGHPMTSGSPQLDYFVGGTEVEGPNPDYAEQLVLIPGLGVSTTAPPAPVVGRERALDDDRLRVVSLAATNKLHHALLDAWEAILADRPRAWLDLLPSVGLEQARRMAPALAKHFRRGRVELHPRLPRETVAELLVDADLYLDSYPFGGFNTLVEVLAAGCPVVTLEGSQARNRFGAAVLRRLGCPEWLIARDWAGYVAAARRLIDDAGLRAAVRAQIGDRDRVLSLLADPAAERHFEAAVAWMLERGPRGGARPGPPVRVEAP